MNLDLTGVPGSAICTGLFSVFGSGCYDDYDNDISRVLVVQ